MNAYVITDTHGQMLNKDLEEWTPDISEAAAFEFFCVAEWTAITAGFALEAFDIQERDVPDPKPRRSAAIELRDVLRARELQASQPRQEYLDYLNAFPLHDPRD